MGHNGTRPITLSRSQSSQLFTLKRPPTLIYRSDKTFLIGGTLVSDALPTALP